MIASTWNFIRHTLTQMGFEDKWCKWIEACQKLATVSVLVNGSPTLEFKMEMGVGLLPFTYLGLPFGGSMKRVSSWNIVVEKFKNGLDKWLFRIEIDKDISVGEKRCWRDGGWAWDWIRFMKLASR
ncbi:hypothetical protein Tco_0265135 [Tanacetum coccineum]